MKVFGCVILLLLISGCIDTTTQPVVGKPNIDISSPQSTSFNPINLAVDVNVSVPIENPRSESIYIEILDAKITANNKDGTKTTMNGYGNSITIAGKTKSNLLLAFKLIPVKYELKTNPLRLTSLISSYDIAVKYKASLTVSGLFPYSKIDTYTDNVPIKDIPLDEKLFIDKLFE